MAKLTLLVALLSAICVVLGASLAGTRTADMDFLHKQKKIFDLLLYVKQSDLSDAEWYDTGRSYNVETNIDMYRDKVIITEMFTQYSLCSVENSKMQRKRKYFYSTFNLLPFFW